MQMPDASALTASFFTRRIDSIVPRLTDSEFEAFEITMKSRRPRCEPDTSVNYEVYGYGRFSENNKHGTSGQKQAAILQAECKYLGFPTIHESDDDSNCMFVEDDDCSSIGRYPTPELNAMLHKLAKTSCPLNTIHVLIIEKDDRRG